jgi:hypothetical protein
MKILRFTDQNFTINVDFKTDLVNDTQSNFTIMSIEGLDSNEKTLGLGFKQLPSNINAMKSFAQTHDLQLTVINLNNKHSSSILVPHSNIYYSAGLGIDHI